MIQFGSYGFNSFWSTKRPKATATCHISSALIHNWAIGLGTNGKLGKCYIRSARISLIRLGSSVVFEELVEYKRTNGNCDVRAKYELNKGLGRWVDNQRYLESKNSLHKDRVAKLESIGFTFLAGHEANKSDDWDLFFEDRFEELIEYKRTHGNCDVPQKYEFNPELGRWVANERSYKDKNSLHKDRVAKLEAIGFVWDKRNGNWDFRFEQLVEYKRIHGNCDMPSNYRFNQKLSCWVVNQRRCLNGRSSLREDRVAKLKSIGFRFCSNRRAAWNTRFEQLVEYKRTHGNLSVPRNHELNQELGRWVANQRYLVGKDSLHRVAKLESIGFNFSGHIRSDWWETFFEKLRDYLRNHGDCNVPEKYGPDPSLSEWVRQQRHDYSLKCDGGDLGAMTAEREAKLNVLGFSWVKRQSSAGSSNNVNALCPDEVASESLPM